MTIALFAIAGVTLVFVACAAPGVVRLHRQDVLFRKMIAACRNAEWSLSGLSAAFVAVGISMKEAADAMSKSFDWPEAL